MEAKTGVNQGGGPAPGYEWTVLVLDVAHKEIQDTFSEAQYYHLIDQVKELARHPDPTHSATLSIKKIEEYYELRDSGGVLGAVNARIFFDCLHDRRAILILGGIFKQNNGATPQGDKIRMRRRLKKYLAE